MLLYLSIHLAGAVFGYFLFRSFYNRNVKAWTKAEDKVFPSILLLSWGFVALVLLLWVSGSKVGQTSLPFEIKEQQEA
ncbi:MAG TPA: hypothetical protein VFR58_04355 [Flavisolibacter sp.]|nr:hypothetical protein [Flavisolibacter sp.]